MLVNEWRNAIEMMLDQIREDEDLIRICRYIERILIWQDVQTE